MTFLLWEFWLFILHFVSFSTFMYDIKEKGNIPSAGGQPAVRPHSIRGASGEGTCSPLPSFLRAGSQQSFAVWLGLLCSGRLIHGLQRASWYIGILLCPRTTTWEEGAHGYLPPTQEMIFILLHKNVVWPLYIVVFLWGVNVSKKVNVLPIMFF